MADLNKESMAIWKSLKPMIDEEIKAQTRGAVQRRKMKVTTAPSLVTNVIGVTEPYGSEMFIPFNTNLSAAHIGDVVWVEFMYGATNAFASMYASADTKDWTVGGDANIMGNATINGVLDVTPRRCFATLSSAGWYRVMQTKDVSGTIINFYIGRPWDSNPAEAHKISFYTVGNGKSAFIDETSDTNTLCVDKIRATYGGGLMWFDVHYNASSANEVLVYFDVCGKGQANGTSIAMGLESVADAPSGETVLTEYVFAENTSIVDVVTTGNVRHSYRRSGNIVVIGMQSLGGISVPQNAHTTVTTLPVGLRPLETIHFAADNTGGSINIGGMVQSNGNVDLYATNASTSYWRFSVSYIV